MPSFSFTQVARGKSLGGNDFPEDVVRLSKKSMVISESVATAVAGNSHTTDAGLQRVNVGISYDTYNQALQLRPSKTGFAFTKAENGNLYGAVPVNLTRAGMPIGDYLLVPNTDNVFQLAR